MITEAKQAKGSAQAGASGGDDAPGAVTVQEAEICEAAKPAPAATVGRRSARADGRAGGPGVVPPRQTQAAKPYLARLEGLAEVLSHHGLRVSLMAPPGRVPSLHVVNPAASVLAEDVYTGRGRDGA